MDQLANLIVSVLENYEGYHLGWLNRNPLNSKLSMTIVRWGGAPEDKLLISLDGWYMDSMMNPYTLKAE